jgi:hypothetical protein
MVQRISSWEAFRRKYNEIANSPEHRQQQSIERRIHYLYAASYLLVGLPLCLLLMKIGFSMGWPVNRVSLIAITIGFGASFGVAHHLAIKKNNSNGGL